MADASLPLRSRTTVSSASAPLPVDVPPAQGFRAFRQRLAHILERPSTNWTIIALAAADGIFTIVQLAYAFVQDKGCSCTDSCGEDPLFFKVLDWLSLTILSIFIIEILLDLVAFGPSHWISARHHWLHCFDSIVVIAAFTLEILPESSLKTVASLLILLRLVRLIKLVVTLEVGTEEYRDTQEKETEERLWRSERAQLVGQITSLRRRLQVLDSRAGSGSDSFSD
ncbi:hypothetical protein JCM10207_001398 [Rhodosporidiobolus poonsookiae]